MGTPGYKRHSEASCVESIDIREVADCSPERGLTGFLRFLTNHVKIKCKRTGNAIPFKPWPCQNDLAALMMTDRWLCLLKARQLGITWMVAAYSVWKMTYVPYYTVVVINQNLPYAKEFVNEKIKFIISHLPAYFRHGYEKDTEQYLKLGDGSPESHGSQLFAVAGNEDAARSITGNLVIVDEASRVEELKACLQAAEPTLANTDGRLIQLSSSAGPRGAFYERWRKITEECGRTGIGTTVFADTHLYETNGKYVGVFFPWNAHPDRTRKWYESERLDHEEDPNYMRQEFPATPEEAFEASGGRIYPRFSNKTLGKGGNVTVIKDFDPAWPRYRAVDWGETTVFVCLWLVEIPSPVPMLTVDPTGDGRKLIDELLAYSWKEGTNSPLKKDDHGPDALRYAVTTFGLSQHVHVYRCWYVHNPTKLGYDAAMLCTGILERSGYELKDRVANLWEPADNVEIFEGTVYDRSRPMLANEFARFDILAWGHTKVSGEAMTRDEDVRSGIVCVNRLIVSSMHPNRSVEKTEEELEDERNQRADVLANSLGIRSTGTLYSTILQNRRDMEERRREFSEGFHPVFGVFG